MAAARRSAGFTQEGLAEALRVDRTTVIRWESGENAPLPYLRPKLGRLLGRSPDQLRELIEGAAMPRAWPGLDAAFRWLDDQAAWGPGGSARRVAGRARRALEVRRPLGRSEIAAKLAAYYDTTATFGFVVEGRRVTTSIVTKPEWSTAARVLGPGAERVAFGTPAEHTVPEVITKAAVARLADAARQDVRLVNAPLYRLLDVTFGDTITARYALAPFAEYALTFDLLESELAAAESPLRDKYLPDLDSVFDIGRRLCVGGVPALCAVARPACPDRGPADFLVFVQERSWNVVNAVGRLAVVPKGFHKPLTDHWADARIVATLRREMEEELFGRDEVDATVSSPTVAAPMHPTRLSAPMRWLSEDPARLRLECTGFGLNLVSGNYEFAGLIVIGEEFWDRFGGAVEANWETIGFRQYSTLDRAALADLMLDETWSNEGLFALARGLRRLREIDPSRVDLPSGR